MSRPWRFVPFFAAVAAIGAALSLGNWQLHRAQEKLAVQQAWDRAERQPPVAVTGAGSAAIGASLPRRVRLDGRFIHAHEIWLENRQMNGQSGFFLITPFRLADGTVVPVNRGFAPRDPRDRTRLPPVERPESELAIEGLAVGQPPRVLQLGDGAPASGQRPLVWQNFEFEQFERISGVAVTPWVVQQTDGHDDGLQRRWPRLNAGVDMHRGYAFQWFALAALIAVLTAFFGYRLLRRRGVPLEAQR